jgi:hypothetical protein
MPSAIDFDVGICKSADDVTDLAEAAERIIQIIFTSLILEAAIT